MHVDGKCLISCKPSLVSENLTSSNMLEARVCAFPGCGPDGQTGRLQAWARPPRDDAGHSSGVQRQGRRHHCALPSGPVSRSRPRPPPGSGRVRPPPAVCGGWKHNRVQSRSVWVLASQAFLVGFIGVTLVDAVTSGWGVPLHRTTPVHCAGHPPSSQGSPATVSALCPLLPAPPPPPRKNGHFALLPARGPTTESSTVSEHTGTHLTRST